MALKMSSSPTDPESHSSVRPSLAESAAAGPGSVTLRSAFPVTAEGTYLNAAGLSPLPLYGAEAIARFANYQARGGAGPDAGFVVEVREGIRARLGRLLGADEEEIGLVSCTKAGERIALDTLDGAPGKNVVTNELHFTGSLHNLAGLARAGREVRVVRATDWRVSLEAMGDAIDGRTALVCVSLVSNVNGFACEVAALAELAHRHGALLYVDIIQAAGIVPLDLHALDVDVAACSSYKWLLGTYGAGFVYVRRELQGTRVPDRIFPGRLDYNREPWVSAVDSGKGEECYRAPVDATRYQAGNVSLAGYCAAWAGLELVERIGVAEGLAHAVRLNGRVARALDPERFRCITPDLSSSPIVTFRVDEPERVAERLQRGGVTVVFNGDRMRISPGLFSTDADIDRMLEVLAG